MSTALAAEPARPRAAGSVKETSDPTRDAIEIRAPATGQVIGKVLISSVEDVRRAVASARRAQEAWALLPVRERAERILRFRNALVERSDELVDLLARETGKPRHEALSTEILPVADTITYFADRADHLLHPRAIEMHLLKHRRAYVHYAPRGVVGIISPWNFPYALTMGDVCAALLAGNAVVAKPSEVTPLITQKAKDIWDAAGMPVDLFQVVHGYGNVGAALIDSGIDKLVFTGGVATGKRVAAMCGERLIPCTLELGGKAPLLALDDCDLERTARAVVWGGFCNSGQVCVSVERVYASDRVHDRLLGRVLQLLSELRQGDPSAEIVDVGSVTFPRQIEVAEAHIKDAVGKGAKLEAGGHKKPGVGMFFEPTILSGCDHTMTVMTEEIFGPVVGFMKVKDEEEAIRLANDSHLGLNAYVFTKDRDRGARIAERVVAGSVIVNDVLVNYGMPETPFGGVKQSGLGRVHGDDSLRDFCQVRHVNVDRWGSLEREIFWHPYTAGSYEIVRKATKALFGGGSVLEKIGSLF